MLFDFASADAIGDRLVTRTSTAKWAVDSEYGQLLDVMVSAPPHLEMVPCCSVTIESLEQGLECDPETAIRQHAGLVRALEAEGVRCHMLPPVKVMPDLSFTRDAILMTPWGLLGLNPSAPHRKSEVVHVRAFLETLGAPMLGMLTEGHVEGGDICILRPGVIVIGYSGERTDEMGARALARLFEARGWEAILYRFDPHFLHLDTQFTVLDHNHAVACVEELDPAFIGKLEQLGLELIPVTAGEVRRLGANLVSLGEGRVLSSADNERLNGELERRGYRVIPVDIGQFARCCGGVHCLTQPLARMPG